MFGTTPCNSFFLPSVNLRLGTLIGMSKNYSHTKVHLAIFRNDVIITSFLMFCNPFVSCLILLEFCTEKLLGIRNQNPNVC